MGVLMTVSVSGAATAKPALKDVEAITEGLIATGIAYEISEVCPSISARKLRGITYLLSLKSQASELGYSDAEIEAYVDDKTEQKRLEALARARLAEMGAEVGNTQTYCVVGQAEITKDSTIGRLLR